MTSIQVAEQAEPPLIRLKRSFHNWRLSLRRRYWLTRKLIQPSLQRGWRTVIATVLLIALNPLASNKALAAAGPTSITAQLADFSFETVEEIPFDTPSAHETHLADGFIEKPTVLTTDIGRPEKELQAREEAERISKAQLAQVAKTQVRRAFKPSAQTSAFQATATTAGNTYSYGYCTWWAKERRPDIPNRWGNASAWLKSAQRSGFATGKTPQAGSVIVTSEGPLGHVGYVEKVEGDELIVSDMNMIGWGKVSKRRMKSASGVIRGYIY
ncbi:CHAP domain-containing protein [Candidatus Berkelbacteria bacterium]|nr:CHAP domain-containing protein [Candidatus Berkelbacteria bacterium]